MKKEFILLNFGKLSVLPVFGIIVLANYAGLNLSYNKYYLESLIDQGYRYTQARNDAFLTHLLSLILATIIFFLLTYAFYRNSKTTFLTTFTLFIVLFQFLLISFLTDWNDMRTNYEYNSDAGAAAVVIIPITVASLLFIGSLFDYVKNSRNKAHV